jgi:hypothetical protein
MADSDRCYQAWQAHDFNGVIDRCTTARHDQDLEVHSFRMQLARLDRRANHETYFRDRGFMTDDLLTATWMSWNLADAYAEEHDGPELLAAIRAARADLAQIDVADLKRGTDPAQQLRSYDKVKSRLDALPR